MPHLYVIKQSAVAGVAGGEHRVVAELDGRGTVDEHTAMCLNYAIRDARDDGAVAIRVDLRDLTAIDDWALALFALHDSECRAAGATLELLLSGHAHHAAIARAFSAAGLGERMLFTDA